MGPRSCIVTRWMRVGIIAGAVAVLCSAPGTSAAANGPQYGTIGQYGEVWRGGGFDACWYDGGTYDGKGCTTAESQPAPGTFIDPVGFAVATGDASTSDGTAIYVLDRTSNLPGNTAGSPPCPGVSPGNTCWRLQKLDDKGNVLGTDELSLPDQDPQLKTDHSGVFNYEMQGLAVDQTHGTIYATVLAYCDTSRGVCKPAPVSSQSTEYVEEVVAWSTTPAASGQLGPPTCPVAPTTTCKDVLSTGVHGYPVPGLVSSAEQLSGGTAPEAGGRPQIVGPSGLTIDATGPDAFLAVAAGDPSQKGAAGITQICVTGVTCSTCSQAGVPTFDTCVSAAPHYGDIRLQWSSRALSGLHNDSTEALYNPAGISTVPGRGSLTLLLDEGFGAVPSGVDVIDVPADLQSKASILASSAPTLTPSPPANDFTAIFTSDMAEEEAGGDPEGNPGTVATLLASPQVAETDNGLYAADFEPDPPGQPDPENPDGQPGRWTALTPGIHLLLPLPDGTLSNNPGPSSNLNPPLTTLVDTVGNPDPNGVCSIGDPISSAGGAAPNPSLAAGSGGTLWVLTHGFDSSGGAPPGGIPGPTYEGGRDLIELAPNQGSRCPTPTGTFTMAPSPQAPPQSGPLTVAAGAQVTFDACPPSPTKTVQCPPTGAIGINTLGAATDQYKWDFGDGSTATFASTANIDGTYIWAQNTATHQYNTAGIFTVTLTMLGDLGEYVQTGTVRVTPGSVPVAAFTYSQPSAPPLTVDVDASGSTPTPGDSIIDYHWDWGDGQIDDTSSPSDSHTYAQGGHYMVKLSVLDSIFGHSQSPATATITMVAPPPAATTSTSGPPPTEGTQPATKPPPPPAISARITPTASRHGVVALHLGCPAAQVSCAGTVLLRTARAVSPPTAKGAHKRHAHKRVLTLGTAGFSITGGSSKPIALVLTRQAITLLRSSHGVRVLITIVARNPEGEKSTRTYALRLRIAAVRQGKR